MKKLLFLLLVVAAVGYGCEKCVTCKSTTTTTASPSLPGYPQTFTTTSEVCGNKGEREDAEAAGNTTSTGTTYGYTITTKISTNCD